MRRWAAVLFAMVCLLSGSLWLLPDSSLGVSGELATLALGAMTATLTVALLRRLAGQRSSRMQGWSWTLALGGIGSLGAPALLLLMGRQQFSSIMAVAVQAGVPVVVVVVSGVFDEGSDLQQGMVPGLIALGGALLVLPVALPASPGGWLGFGLYLLAAFSTGICSVLCYREMRRVPPLTAVSIVTVANALFLCATAAVWLTITGQWNALRGTGGAPNLIATALTNLDILGVAGLLYLMRPLTLSTRFVFVPALATLEAYALMRPSVSVRTGVGLLLMLGGGLACFRADRLNQSRTDMSLH